MHGLDFTSPALLTPAAALQPPLLRIGGSAQRSYPVCFGEDHPEPHNATCLTRRYWSSLCGFAAALNTSMIYGLHNDAAPTGNMALIAAVAADRGACPALGGFSVGNEGVPGSNATFHAVAAALAAMPAASGRGKLLLVGPESPMMPSNADYFVPLATALIEEVGGVLDAATFHFYAFNSYQLGIGRRGIGNASLSAGNLSRLWSPRSLNAVADSVAQFKAVLESTTHPDLPVWLSESNSICSGGVDGLSNTYANTPWLLNQLGQLSRAGVAVMAQQTLIGEDYGLLSGRGDRTQDPRGGWLAGVTARPNFFALYLHERLVGDTMLHTTAADTHAGSTRVQDTAAYAYCAASRSSLEPRGGVTMVLINFATDGPRTFDLKVKFTGLTQNLQVDPAV
jgi:hypothetical protein